MQKSPLNYTSTTDPSSSSSSSSSQFHSLITTHSLLTSSIDSSSSSFQSFHSPSPTRCFGLNLLVKAIHQITAGSVVGVPYIQKRILTRRRRPIHFNNLILTTTQLLSKSRSKPEMKLKSKPKANKRQRRVHMAMPSKFRDSVLQPLVPRRRSERSRSPAVKVKIAGE